MTRTRIAIRTAALAALALLVGSAPAWTQEARQKEAPPPPAPMRPVDFPEFHERTLKNGAKVIIVENHEQPVVSLELRIASGAKHDPASKAGVASFTASLLDKGTATRTADQIAETIDFVGGSLGASAGDDAISVGASALTEFLDTALVLVSDIVRNPTFPEDELETERRRMLSALQASLGQPQYLAERQFMREIYGEHPYGAMPSPESVRAITRDDLVGFHRTHFKPGNALFVVAGDVRPDDIVRRLEQHFGGWTGAAPAKASLPAPQPRSARELVFVHKPGAVQAVIRVGHLLPPATHPDWIALDVAQQILGGGTTGWFFQVLRQEKGYTYGAYANFAQRLEPGYFQAWAEVRNEVADSALAEFFRLIAQLRDQDVPAADLQTAKDFMTGSFPLRIETPQQVARQIASARQLGLPNDYVATYRDKIAAITAAEVRRAAQAHIQPDRAVVVVVGDATQILDKVEKFGSARLLDADGNPLARSDIEVKASEVALDGSSIEPATRVYDVMFQGNAVASATTTVTREQIEGVDAVRSVTEMGGMGTMRQEVAFEAATFRPLFSRIEQQMGPASVSIDLRVEGGKVVGNIALPGAEPREVSLDAVQGLLLPGMDEYAIMVADLAPGASFTLPSVDGQSGALSNLTIRVAGESTVAVGAGEFEVYELELTGGATPMKLLVTKAAPHVVVKQEIAGQPVSIELKEQK
jgi:zinc protease